MDFSMSFEPRDYLDESAFDNHYPWPRFLTMEGSTAAADTHRVNNSQADTDVVMSSPVISSTLAASSPIVTEKGISSVKLPDNPAISKPITFLKLPIKARNKVYAYFFEQKSEVLIHSLVERPAINATFTSPYNLVYASRQVAKEATTVFYGTTRFHLQHPYGIGYMTARMGLLNCRKIHFFTVFLEHVGDITETIKTIFPELQVLAVRLTDEWYGAWYGFLHQKNGGNMEQAVNDVLGISCGDGTGVGLSEMVKMSLFCKVAIRLKLWANGPNYPAEESELRIAGAKWGLYR